MGVFNEANFNRESSPENNSEDDMEHIIRSRIGGLKIDIFNIKESELFNLVIAYFIHSKIKSPSDEEFNSVKTKIEQIIKMLKEEAIRKRKGTTTNKNAGKYISRSHPDL